MVENIESSDAVLAQDDATILKEKGPISCVEKLPILLIKLLFATNLKKYLEARSKSSNATEE